MEVVTSASLLAIFFAPKNPLRTMPMKAVCTDRIIRVQNTYYFALSRVFLHLVILQKQQELSKLASKMRIRNPNTDRTRKGMSSKKSLNSAFQSYSLILERLIIPEMLDTTAQLGWGKVKWYISVSKVSWITISNGHDYLRILFPINFRNPSAIKFPIET